MFWLDSRCAEHTSASAAAIVTRTFARIFLVTTAFSSRPQVLRGAPMRTLGLFARSDLRGGPSHVVDGSLLVRERLVSLIDLSHDAALFPRTEEDTFVFTS